jgi:hypothetical protein
MDDCYCSTGQVEFISYTSAGTDAVVSRITVECVHCRARFTVGFGEPYYHYCPFLEIERIQKAEDEPPMCEPLEIVNRFEAREPKPPGVLMARSAMRAKQYGRNRGLLGVRNFHKA